MKFYNVGKGEGDQLHVPTFKRRGPDGVVKEYVHVPPLYTGIRCEGARDRELCKCGHESFREHVDGNVYLALPLENGGFMVIPKGAWIEKPFGITPKALRMLSPHLVPEDEHEFDKKALEATPVVSEASAAVAEGKPEKKRAQSNP